MRDEGVDLLFLGLSADLEYLTGIERGIPFFGQSSYVHGWVTGAFFRPDADPTFVLPRMVAAFDLNEEVEGEVVVVNETVWPASFAGPALIAVAIGEQNDMEKFGDPPERRRFRS